MEKAKDLQVNNGITLSVEKTFDLFRAKPIMIQKAEHGEKIVLMSIRVAVEKLIGGLGINLSDNQIEMLCEDICDVYPYDSIEDVQQCLKKARQGKYGFGHHKRDIVTMGLIREWMAQHLEEKAKEREEIIHNRKTEEVAPANNEKALEYLAKIKSMLSEKIKEQSSVKPFENTESAWKELIKTDPLIREFFSRV